MKNKKNYIKYDDTETGYIREFYNKYYEDEDDDLKLYAEYFRLNGKKEGKYIRYDKKGYIITESNYINGKLHGLYKEKHYDNIKEVYYCYGKIISIL